MKDVYYLVEELGKAILALVEAPFARPDQLQRLLHLRQHPVSRNGAHLSRNDGAVASQVVSQRTVENESSRR